MKCFKPSSPKDPKEKYLFLARYQVYSIIVSPLFRAVSVCYNEGVFSFFLKFHSSMINKFIHVIRRKNTKKIIIDIFISQDFYSISNLNITDSLAHFFI